MNINKIKQVIQLQREIKTENENIIEIDMLDEKVLIRPELFKKLFAEKEYKVRFNGKSYFYYSEFDSIQFETNNETPLFDFIGENKKACNGCKHENADGSTAEISNCVCCNRTNDLAKNDYYEEV